MAETGESEDVGTPARPIVMVQAFAELRYGVVVSSRVLLLSAIKNVKKRDKHKSVPLLSLHSSTQHTAQKTNTARPIYWRMYHVQVGFHKKDKFHESSVLLGPRAHVGVAPAQVVQGVVVEGGGAKSGASSEESLAAERGSTLLP